MICCDRKIVCVGWNLSSIAVHPLVLNYQLKTKMVSKQVIDFLMNLVPADMG